MSTNAEAQEVCVNGHGQFYDQAYRGVLYSATQASVAPGTALTTTPPLILWNPPTAAGAQPVNLELVECAVGYVSGTLGAGVVVYGFNAQSTAPTAGTAITVRNMKVGGSAGIGQAFSGSTLLTTPTLLKPCFVFGAATAATAALPAPPAIDVVDGKIIVPPGFALSIVEVGAAGTTPLVMPSFTWAESKQA